MSESAMSLLPLSTKMPKRLTYLIYLNISCLYSLNRLQVLIRDLKHRRWTRGRRRRKLSEVWVENVVHGGKTEMLSSRVDVTEDVSCKQTENLYPQFYFNAFISRATRAFTSKPWFWCNRWWRLTAALWRVCAKKLLISNSLTLRRI